MGHMNERWSELEKFVGRDSELKKFEGILGDPTGAKRTLLIQGAGGQGKTWLIKMMLLLALAQPDLLTLEPDSLVDMYSTSNRHLEGVLEALAQQLIRNSREIEIFQPYRRKKGELEAARQQLEYSSEELAHKVKEVADIFRGCLQKLTEQQTVVLAFDTFENVHGSEVADWILSETGLQMPNLICLVGTRQSLSSEEKKKYPSVSEVILGGLGDEEAVAFYLQYAKEKEISTERKEFIRVLNHKSGRNPLMLGLAIIYLDLPENNPESVKQLSQEKFEREVVACLSPNYGPGSVWISGIEYNEQLRQSLVLMAYLNRRFNSYFLKHLVDEGYIQLGDAKIDRLWATLNYRKPDLFFVKERPKGEIQLHDKLAEMLRKYVLVDAFNDSTGERLNQFTNDVVDWYDGLINNAASSENLYAEQLGYLLRRDLYNDCKQQIQTQTQIEICLKLRSLAPKPEKVISVLDGHRRRRSDILARLILAEIEMPIIEQFDLDVQYRVCSLLGQIASQSYLHLTAQIYWKKAFDVARLSKNLNQQVESLVGLHNSTFQTDPQHSLDILTQARQLCEKEEVKKRLPTVLYEIGFSYFQLHDLEISTKFYQEAKKQASALEDADIMPILLNDEGYNHLLTGDIARARITIRAARDLRLQRYNNLKEQRVRNHLSKSERDTLDDQIDEAALMLGLSYSTLGDLARFSGRLDEATRRYGDALEIFKEAHSSYWQARMYFSRGETYRRRAMYAYLSGRLDLSKEFEVEAKKDIETSLGLCQQLGYIPDSVTAIRRLGRLYHDQMFRTQETELKTDYLKQAREKFEEALRLARTHKMTLEILENLTEIAFLADDNLTIAQEHSSEEFEAQRKQAVVDIRELENYITNLPQKEHVYQFPVFQHLLEIEQAAYHFLLGEYSKALNLYIEGYRGMAQNRGYGVARYIQHMDHLVKQLRLLFKRDRKLSKEWCAALLDAWNDAELTEKRPELPQEIEMFMDTAFLYVDDK